MHPNIKRTEALLNEYKGNFFEFLVAKKIAQSIGLEVTFLKNFSENEIAILTQQEEYIRNYFPEYLNFLPKASELTASKILDKLEIADVKSIRVIGKEQASISSDYSEADIVIEQEKKKHYISLKLCKSSSFVNTKSAGVKSFFSKYFDGEKIQAEFNKFWELEYEALARDMHNHVDIEFTKGFESWIKLGKTQLPGELGVELKELLHTFYNRINLKLKELLLLKFDSDSAKFNQYLLPLLGFSDSKLMQVSSFYNRTSQGLELKNVHILYWQELNSFLKHEFELRVNKTNLELCFKDLILQIRLKPMNTFTQPGYKINCSVKYFAN